MIKKAVRQGVDSFTQLLAWINRKQKVRLNGRAQNKVNIGCGMTVAPRWINIDGSLNAWFATKPKWSHPLAYQLSGAKEFSSREAYLKTLGDHRFVHHDTRYGLPLPSNSVDFIYSSHFLEHLSRSRGRLLLKECFRALKPGGIVRICVPDLEYAWEMYQQGDTDHMLHDYFFVGYGEDIPAYSRHRYSYDFRTLSIALREVGFEGIERASFRQGQTPDLEILDNREGYGLFVEARKPGGSETSQTSLESEKNLAQPAVTA